MYFDLIFLPSKFLPDLPQVPTHQPPYLMLPHSLSLCFSFQTTNKQTSKQSINQNIILDSRVLLFHLPYLNYRSLISDTKSPEAEKYILFFQGFRTKILLIIS